MWTTLLYYLGYGNYDNNDNIDIVRVDYETNPELIQSLVEDDQATAPARQLPLNYTWDKIKNKAVITEESVKNALSNLNKLDKDEIERNRYKSPENEFIKEINLVSELGGYVNYFKYKYTK